MKKLLPIIVFLIAISIIGTNPSFASVTINGQVKFSSSNTNFYANSSAITANSITVSSSGITTTANSGDALYTYDFTSAGTVPLNIQWTGLSGSEADFKVLSTATDVQASTTGNALSSVNVDGGNTLVSYFGGVNTFAVNAGKVINEFLTGGGGGGGGGGSGGGGGGTPYNPAAGNGFLNQLSTNLNSLFNTNPLIFSINQKSYQLQAGQNLQDNLLLSWNTSDNITINSISVGQSPVNIVFQQTPLTFNGSPQPPSSGNLLFNVVSPSDYCTNLQTTNCVEHQAYNIPITVSGLFGNGTTIQRSTIITLDYSQNLGVPYYYLFAIVAFGAIGLWRLTWKTHKKTPKKSNRELESKPSKRGKNDLKQVENLLKKYEFGENKKRKKLSFIKTRHK